jgi:hypothetical protein
MERYRPAPRPEPSETPENKTPKRTRGRPFRPGNPGRPVGSKNRTTQFVEQLMGNDAENLTRKAIDLALAGDPRLLQFCLDRLMPRRNGRPVDLPLPAVSDIDDVVTTAAVIATAVCDGDLTTAEADQLMSVLERFVKISETPDIVDRLDAIELRLKERP